MIGLTGMRERAAAVGGTLEIEPTPNGGTTVLAHIPIAHAVPHRTQPGCRVARARARTAEAARRRFRPTTQRRGAELTSRAAPGIAAGGGGPGRIHRNRRARAAQPGRPADVSAAARDRKIRTDGVNGRAAPRRVGAVAASANRTTSASIARNARPPAGRVAPVNRAHRSPAGVDESRTDGSRGHRHLRGGTGRGAMQAGLHRTRGFIRLLGSGASRADLPESSVERHPVRRRTAD